MLFCSFDKISNNFVIKASFFSPSFINSLSSAFPGWLLTDPSPAVLFRSINIYKNTLFIDELEHLANNKGDYSSLMSLLNTGFQKKVQFLDVKGKAKKLFHFQLTVQKCLRGLIILRIH